MAKKTAFLIANLLGIALAVILYFANDTPLMVSVIALKFSATGGAALLVGYGIGVLMSYAACFPLISLGKQANSQKLQQWQDQDVKLAASIKSDREKQLEAKITTLESALKQALGKK